MIVKNYTTQIKVEKTLSEIEPLLIDFGAQGIYKEYEGSRIKSLSFIILDKQGTKIPFKIPLSIEKSRTVVDKLVQKGKLPQKYKTEPLRSEQGERISWRVIKDWINAQLSLYHLNFAEPTEIFLPYAYDMVENKTLYQKFLENKENFLSLEYKEDD